MSDADLDPGQPDEPDDAALAAEYVLRLLDPTEEAACAARVAQDPAFAAEVRAGRPPSRPSTPSSRAGRRQRDCADASEARLFGPPPPLARAALGRASRSGAAWPRGGRGGAGGRSARPPARRPRPRPLVATVAPAAPATDNVQLVALLDREAGLLRFTRIAGAAPPGSSLELWVMPEGARLRPRSAWCRRRSGSPCRYRRDRGASPGTAILVSLEAAGGSPTGQPQGPVLAQGAIGEL